MKESNHRDRAEMQLVADEHVKAVLQFMQWNIPAAKLIGVAEKLPEMARLLWGHNLQEPVRGLSLVLPKMHPSQPIATESALGPKCAGDGSAVAVGAG